MCCSSCLCLAASGHTLTPSNHGLLTTLAHQLGPSAAPSYALEGSVAVAGLGISWLRDNLRIIDSADDSEPIAASVSGQDAWAVHGGWGGVESRRTYVVTCCSPFKI
jgi:glycerol kinase